MASDTIYKIVAFLKYLYDNTREGKAITSLPELLAKHKVPYPIDFASILIDKGILQKTITGTRSSRNVLYHWITSTEPNLNMADAILNVLRERRIKRFKLPSKISNLPKTEFPIIIKCNNNIEANHIQSLIHCENAIVSLENTLLINKNGYVILKNIQDLLNAYLK